MTSNWNWIKNKKYEFDSWFKIEIQERENSKYYKSLLFEILKHMQLKWYYDTQ